MDSDEDFITLDLPSKTDTPDDATDESSDDHSTGDSPEEEEEEDPLSIISYDNEKDLPPWMNQYTDFGRTNYLVALHNELVDFCKLMEPQEEEMKQRQEVVKTFSDLVHSTFDNAKVEVFGSQVTGLCLPTSDIDIAIQLDEGAEDSPTTTDTKEDSSKSPISSEQERKDMENWDTPTGSPLQALAGALREQWMNDLTYLEVIENTRVPLVKFIHKPTQIAVDVCFNQKSGVQAATLMKRYMDAIPPLRPLTFVLKYFLASRGLNQPYTGGVGSFMLQMMILSFLQHREREAQHNRRPINYSLGGILLEFFEYYSLDFNFMTVGASVRFDGFFFPKGASDQKLSFWQPARPFSYAMENPLEPTMDVGAPSFKIGMVQRTFEVAFKVLLCHTAEPVQRVTSILASILPPTQEMLKRSKQTRVQPLSASRSNGTSDDKSARSPPRKRRRR